MLRNLFRMIITELYERDLKMYAYNSVWEIPVEVKK